MACIFGHKWDGCKCTKCGETRNEEHNWEGAKCKRCGDMRCEKCGTTKKQLEKESTAQKKQMKKMGIGMMIFNSSIGFTRCVKCGKIVCNKCGLDIGNRTVKSCPFCKEQYTSKSII